MIGAFGTATKEFIKETEGFGGKRTSGDHQN